MLEVELDIFSGMPNPRWLLTSAEERELVDRLSAEPEQVSPVATPDEEFGLGYRGLLVRMVKPADDSPWAATRAEGQELPQEFRVGSRPAARDPIAEWLLQTFGAGARTSQVTDELREVASRGVTLLPGSTAVEPGRDDPGEGSQPQASAGERTHTPGRTPAATAEQGPLEAATWWDCPSDFFAPNVDVFNAPERVLRNNCYCFASNHLADVRGALPGRRGGRPATSLTCGGVIDGLHADGWQEDCQEGALTIVLVIWPNEDYHFYRLVTGAPHWWWGHKPGGMPAGYRDDCSRLMYLDNSPIDCCRGPYTDFCGYFYQNNETAYVG